MRRVDDLRNEKIKPRTYESFTHLKVEDVASTIAFLCSPGAAHINGQTIVVDGGWSTTKYLSPEALNAEWVSTAQD